MLCAVAPAPRRSSCPWGQRLLQSPGTLLPLGTLLPGDRGHGSPAVAGRGREPGAEVTVTGLNVELVPACPLAPGWAPDTAKPGSAGTALRSLSPGSLPGWE